MEPEKQSAHPEDAVFPQDSMPGIDTLLQSLGSDETRVLDFTSAPTSEFSQTILDVLNIHLPRVTSLTKSVLNGVIRAYETDVDPDRTADDMASLRTSLEALKHLLNESGIGALPLDPPKQTSDPNVKAPLDIDEVTRQVEQVYGRVQNKKDAAVVALDILDPQSVGSVRR